jgi:hypothetical protein
MQEIKAIETHYKGYRFRSRLEARWAVFFDDLGMRWEYEKEGFDLGNAGKYLPDFWMSDMKCWIEIKPDGEDGAEKARALSRGDYPVIVLSGNIGQHSATLYCNDTGNSGGGESDWIGTLDKNTFYINISEDTCILDSKWEPLKFVIHGTAPDSFKRDFAYTFARSVRFEYFETPKGYPIK